MNPISLGKFYPSKLDPPIIAFEFIIFLQEKGIRLAEAVPVRIPDDHLHLTIAQPTITRWHRDGLSKQAEDRSAIPKVKWMLLWSNGTPTHLADLQENEFKFEPFDVILVDNINTLHKAPAAEPNRFFIRILDPQICLEDFSRGETP